MFRREDLKGENLNATLKSMPTGEIRCRMKTEPALMMRTVAVHITKAIDLTWQGQFHRHLQLCESYVVVAGKIGMVSWDGIQAKSRVVNQGDQLIFLPGVWHNICTTPESEFVTIQVSNQDVVLEDDREVQEDLPRAVSAEMQRVLCILLNS